MTFLTRRLGRREVRGQAIVEFALASVVFLMTVLAIFEGGRLVVGYAVLTYAVQEGGRAAALPPPVTTTADGVCDQIVEKAVLITPNCLSVNIQALGGGPKAFAERTTGDRVEVTGTYAFEPVVAGVFGGAAAITLSYTAVFMVE